MRPFVVAMRPFVVAMMLASASSFAPSPRTQLASRRPAQAPPRVMPAMKLTPGNPLYYIGFPSQCQKDDEIREANDKRDSDFFLAVCVLTGFACGKMYLMLLE